MRTSKILPYLNCTQPNIEINEFGHTRIKPIKHLLSGVFLGSFLFLLLLWKPVKLTNLFLLLLIETTNLKLFYIFLRTACFLTNKSLVCKKK